MYIPALYFRKIPSIGDLYLDEIFLQDDCLLLFTLTHDNRKFITICRSNIHKQKWVLYEINDQILDEMKRGVLTLKQGIKAFPAGTSAVVLWDKETNDIHYRVFVNVAHDIESLDDNIMINEPTEDGEE